MFDRRARGVGWVLAALAIGGPAAAQEGLPPDTLTTVFDGDTIPGMGAVGGVAVDALGYVYVADFRNGVWRYEPGGAVVHYADGLYGASGNAIGPRGELYQSSFHGGTIHRIPRDGEPVLYADEGLQGPVGIAVGPEGDLFVCDCNANTIVRVTTDGTVHPFAEGPLFTCPNGVTFDDRGDLYVVNFGNTHVVRVTPDGEPASFVQVPGRGGNGHIAFARGRFYVTKFRGHQVFRVDRDGTVSAIAGTGQRGQSDGPALESMMSQPNGIAVSTNGREVWVNDLVSGAGVAGGAARSTLRRIRLVTLTDLLLAGAPTSGGVSDVEGAYRRYRTARPSEDVSAEAIAVAFQFLADARVTDAVTLLEVNASAYPANAAAVFNLGEAYRYTGQPDAAARQYRRVLELQPDHAQAAQRLAMVGGAT